MIRISAQSLKSGMKLGKSIYSEEGRLLLGRGVIINEFFIKNLSVRGISSVFIHDDSTDDVNPQESITEMVRGSTIGHLKELFGSLEEIRNTMKNQSYEAVSSAVTSRQFVEMFGNSPAFQKITDDASKIVDQLMSGEVTLGLNSIKTYDNYTFQHSVDVTIVSIMMGRKIGLPPKRLHELGIGCLLHDMGKVLIPVEIVNKPDKLTPSEYEIMKTHSVIGYELTKGVAAIGVLPPHVAFQHHEKQDGTGYPRGLKGSNNLKLSMEPRTIHLYGNISAVADVYDALSSDRPYRAALPPEKVFAIMREMNNTHLNTEALSYFHKIAPIYPVGTTIRVTSTVHRNFLGVVVSLNEGKLDRPVIRLVYDAHRKKINPIQINLASDDDVSVESIIL
ncbi:HD-GYP domain-containing protein [bacterium]|nr:HD-GYP domain-containing protein [bacterium]